MEKHPDRKVLIIAFSINAVLFVAELIAGLLASSMGLIADSLDMLADAFSYGLALAAVGAPFARQRLAARSMGYFEVALALLGLVEVLRRFFFPEELPDTRAMIGVSLVALAGNAATLLVLRKRREGGILIRASWICTSNDVQVNLLVMVSAVLVHLVQRPWPDLLIAGIIFMLAARAAARILALKS